MMKQTMTIKIVMFAENITDMINKRHSYINKKSKGFSYDKNISHKFGRITDVKPGDEE